MQQRLLLIPLLSLILRRENDNSYRVFDFFLAPSQELLYCHPELQMMMTMHCIAMKVMVAMMIMTMTMMMV